MVSGTALFSTTTTKRQEAEQPSTLTQSSKPKFPLEHPSKFCYCDHLQSKPKKKVKSKAHLEQTLQKNKGGKNHKSSTMLKDNL